MSNHKARFRGDLQVDGSIVGPDGQPIGGGVDWSALVPEINFAGDPTDSQSGATLAWDQDYYAMVLKGQPGSNDAELYLVNPDNISQQFELWPGGFLIAHDSLISVLDPNNGFAFRDNSKLYPSFTISRDGEIHWGDGMNPSDVTLKRSGVGWMDLDAQGLQIFHPQAELWVVEDEDWNNFAGYGITGWDVEFPTGAATLRVNSEQVQFSMFDAFGGWYTNTRQAHFYAGADDPTHIFWAWGVLADGGNMRWKFDYNGRLHWGPGSTGPDTHLKRRAAGVLELEENGGGLVLHSPDGTAYKISVANGGALSAVAA